MRRLIILGGLLLMIAVSIIVLMKVERSSEITSHDEAETTIQINHNHSQSDNHNHNSKDQAPEKAVYYQGEVVSFEHGGGYTFIEVKEQTELTFWIAVEKVDVNMGDVVRFRKELVAKNYTSKSLNKTFDEIMFASDIQYQLPK